MQDQAPDDDMIPDAPVDLGSDDHADPADPLDLVEDPLEAAARRWRLAASLTALRQQIDTLAPHRSKASDGSIRDAAHASRASDHNPWVIDDGVGVVTAIDVTHDPAGGCDAALLADTLRKGHDARIKYVISNRRIASAKAIGAVPAWAWRAYTGANPHDHHCHISVMPTKARYDSAAAWPIEPAFGGALEAVAGVEGPDEAVVEVGYGLDALVASVDDGATPLLVRLKALQDGVDALLSSYAGAVRDPIAEDADIVEAAAPTFESLKADYTAKFAACTIPASHAGIVAWHRKMVLAGKPHYQEAQAKTGVPWWFVGIVHGMEASFNFQGHLHNGDPLSARTVNVPAGRPPQWNPPSDWLSSAIDALTFEGYAGAADWSAEHALYRWEAYNGWGYRRLNVNTPYLWSFSSLYTAGKFVADHKYDPHAVSKQCGAAVMLKALQNGGDVTF
jgi:lysozyme family protein